MGKDIFKNPPLTVKFYTKDHPVAILKDMADSQNNGKKLPKPSRYYKP